MGERASIGVRLAREADLPFILSSWLNSYRDGSYDAKRMPPWYYFSHHEPLVRTILARPSCVSLMAHDPEDDAVTYGYVVAEKGIADRDVVHYAYTKEAWQRLGICTALLAAAVDDPRSIYYSHITQSRVDKDDKSPSYGKVRWHGGETLLRKWGSARWWHEEDRKTKKMTPQYRDGNIYAPYLAYMKYQPPKRTRPHDYRRSNQE